MLNLKLLHLGRADKPTLIWLHGLLGNADEFSALVPHCENFTSYAIDLPGHGKSGLIDGKNFDHVSQLLNQTLSNADISQYWLIGYSLGGRIAMYHACRGNAVGLQGLIVEGSHPGLTDEKTRHQRVMHDTLWAAEFAQHAMEDVLDDWYQQPIFGELDDEQREALVIKRSENHGVYVAQMLQATSLGEQPDLTDDLKQLQVPFVYFCGERDNKFQTLAKSRGLPLITIAGAGHNAHWENPCGYISQLANFIK